MVSVVVPSSKHQSPRQSREPEAWGSDKKNVAWLGAFSAQVTLLQEKTGQGGFKYIAEIQRKLRVWTVVKDTGRQTETRRGENDTLPH